MYDEMDRAHSARSDHAMLDGVARVDREVPRLLEALRREHDVLVQAWSELEERLRPVLRENIEQDAAGGCAEMPHTKVGGEVQGASTRCSELRASIASVLDRLEL